jgi:hypothetical protein
VSPALWALIGALAGAVEVAFLRHAAHSRLGPTGLAWRMLMVGSVLVAAVLAAQLLPAAAGWATGFALSGFVAVRRIR